MDQKVQTCGMSTRLIKSSDASEKKTEGVSKKEGRWRNPKPKTETPTPTPERKMGKREKEKRKRKRRPQRLFPHSPKETSLALGARINFINNKIIIRQRATLTPGHPHDISMRPKPCSRLTPVVPPMAPMGEP